MLEKLTPATAVAQGRLDHGPPVAVIDIGSNSVRLVVYEGLTRSPTPLFNEKVLAGLGREVQTNGPARRRRGREGARRADALPRAVRHHAGRSGCGCWRPPPAATRATARTSSPRPSSICAHQDRRAVRPARGGAVGARRHLRLPSRPTASSAISAAARSNWSTCTAPQVEPGVTLPLGGLALQDLSGALAQEGREDRRGRARRRQAPARRRGPRLLRGRRHLARARAAAHGADRLSAARHARLRHPRQGGAGVLPPGAAGRPRDAVADRGRDLARAGRCSPMRALVLEHIMRDGRAARGRDLGARRARGPALFAARRRGAQAATRCSPPRRSSTCCARARRSTARS